jgi:uncharacterized membrane protein
MNRKELDELIEHYQLTAHQVERALALAHARPTAPETSRFAIRTLLLSGVLSLAAGIVFFIAANWSELRIVGRFVLTEALLLVTLMLALWQPPPRPLGRYALFGAFMLVGALLALFGQTYQTGANIYELFLTWTALGLPLVIAGLWAPLWAAWVLVLNLALGLFCGLRPEGGPIWFLFSAGWGTPTLLLIATLANLALWALAEILSQKVAAAVHLVPSSLRRLVLACAIGFATWAGILAILRFGPYPTQTDGWSVLWMLAILAGVAAYTMRRRADVLPLMLIASSIILVVMFAIGKNTGSGRMGRLEMALLVALWLIISSGAAARIIMKLLRTWRAAEQGA